MVLHSFKKITGGLKHSKIPESAEFNDFKQRLDNIAKALEATSASVSASQKLWKSLSHDQAKAIENYMNMYPDDDSVRKMAGDAHAASVRVTSDFAKNEDSHAAPIAIDKHVKEFLNEVKALNAEYKRVGGCKVEYDMYHGKVDGLENAKKQDDEKIQRNKTKLEEARINFENVLAATIKRQKELYAKRQSVFKASFVAYWLAQGSYIAFLQNNYSGVVKYAKANESAMLQLDINALPDENTVRAV